MRLRQLAVVAGLVLLGTANEAAATKTYYIDDNTDNTGNGCPGMSDLNDVTTNLQNMLRSDGWTGARYNNASSWPQDFMEACSSSFGSSGLDSAEADAAAFSVFSGHGNTGLLAWGAIRNGVCTLTMQSNMRLGSMAGASSVISAYASCCTLNANSLPAQANYQWNRQALGFHDLCEIGDTDVSDAIGGTYSSTNQSSWFGHLEDRPGWFTGDNSPMVVSYGSSSTDAADVAAHSSLRQQIRVDARTGGPSCGGGQPFFYYSATWIDHGNGGCS